MDNIKKNILLVEDDVIIALSESEMLKQFNYNVVIAHNYKQAMNSIDENNIDLILMDINLGDSPDGTVIAKDILKIMEIPIIFLTSHAESEYVEKVKKITRYGYILKNSGSFVINQSIEMAFELFSTHKKEVNAKNKVIKAEKDWENIFNAIGQPTLILNTKHEIISANKAVVEASGKKRDEIIGMKCYEIFHNKNKVPSGCPLVNLSQSDSLTTVEMEMQAFGGYFLVSCTPVKDKDGNLEKIIHIATDITVQKRMEEERNNTRNEIINTLEASPVHIFRFKKNEHNDYIAVLSEGVIAKEYNITTNDIINKPLEKIFSPKAYEIVIPYYKKAFNGEQVLLEAPIKDKWFRTNLFPYSRDTNDMVTEIVGYSYEITEFKKIENEILQYKNLVDNSTDAICMADSRGKHFYQNKSADKLFGYIGETPPDTTYVDKNRGIEVFKTLLSGKTWTGEVDMFDKNKNIKNILLRAFPVKNHKDEVVNIVGIHTDISEQKKINNTISIIVQDTGTGIDDLSLKTSTNTFGFQLINALILQYKGEFNLKNNTGLMAEVILNLPS